MSAKVKAEAPAPAGRVIRRVPVASLHHDPENARTHDDENLSTIISSLVEFGQVEPLVVQEGTGRVIGGNGRLTCMIELGHTECDIVEVKADDSRAAALGLALNRTAELGGWDDPKLADVLASLDESGFDVALLGFDGVAAEPGADPVAPPPAPVPMPVKPPPRMAWVLIGISVARYGEIDRRVRALAATPGIFCETSISMKDVEAGGEVA